MDRARGLDWLWAPDSVFVSVVGGVVGWGVEAEEVGVSVSWKVLVVVPLFY